MLAVTGAAMVGAHIAIHVMREGTGGELLDFQLTGEAARALLEELKARPNAVGIHIYITAIADMIYPLAYGLFVAGVCSRYARARPWLCAAPILIAAGLDYGENSVQLLALLGDGDMLDWKSLLTPAKFAFAALGSVIAVTLWARAVFFSR